MKHTSGRFQDGGGKYVDTIRFRPYCTNMDYLPRNLLPKVERLLKNFPAVAILGVRQCGKSTLAKMVGKNWKLMDLENPAHRETLRSDPMLFFQENPERVIFDEVQMEPELFAVLRSVIDQNRHQNGRFILSGSSSFELNKNISESLAGRIAIVECSPMKMNELKGESLSNFYGIFERKISKKDLEVLKRLVPTKTIQEVKHFLLKGGYPQPLIKNDPRYHRDWMENYFSTYINRDMRALFPAMDILKYRRVIKMLSRLSGTILNKSEIARSAETSEKSVRDYLEIVSGTFFWRTLPAYKTSKIKTTLSSPKGHYRDSGLLFYLQNVFSQEELDCYPGLGNAYESFIVEEILRGIQSVNGVNLAPWHFRTKAGAEIDLILEGSFGLLPVEIKYRSHVKKSELATMQNFIKLHKLPYGLVVSNCQTPSLVGDNIVQIPVGCL